MNLNCIAIDDEPLALEHVCSFVDQTPFLDLVGSFESALEALKAIQDKHVDLIFLDIQMSDLTGLELARVLGNRSNKPLIIFTTAFDQFAIESYKLDALDYLLKPFNYKEFLRAALKAQSYKEMQHGSSTTKEEKDFMFLKVEYQLVKVMYNDIIYIEGYKDYVKVHVSNQKHPILSLTSLKGLEEKLPLKKFIRIHRSYIIAINKIISITKNTVLIGDKNLPISEHYREQFHAYMESGY